MNPVKETPPENLKYLVRIVDTDLNGKKTILYELAKIKGVGVSFANALCILSNIDSQQRVGTLTEAQIKKLDEIIQHPLTAGIPPWLFNRSKDVETGENKHLVTSELQFAIDNDIKLMKKIKCYKGIRHILGQPVRGQRTRSKFRKNKGNVLGVKVASGTKKGGKT